MIRYVRPVVITICLIAIVVNSVVKRAEDGRLGPVIAALLLLAGVWVWMLWVNREKVKGFLARLFTFSLSREDVFGTRRSTRFSGPKTGKNRIAHIMIVTSYILIGTVAIVSIINKIKGSDGDETWEVISVTVGFVLNMAGNVLKMAEFKKIKPPHIFKK